MIEQAIEQTLRLKRTLQVAYEFRGGVASIGVME
jgi:hypothetical protein